MPLRFRQEIQAVSRQANVRKLDVVAGILLDPSGRVLITERLEEGPFKGLWEFPGGKIGELETAQAALERDLSEEIGIKAIQAEYFTRLYHEYPDRHVAIEFFLVSQWSNEPRGLEGQRLRWIDVVAIEADLLLPADAPVVEALKRRFCEVDSNSRNRRNDIISPNYVNAK